MKLLTELGMLLLGAVILAAIGASIGYFMTSYVIVTVIP